MHDQKVVVSTEAGGYDLQVHADRFHDIEIMNDLD